MNRRTFLQGMGMAAAGAGTLSLYAGNPYLQNYRTIPARAKNLILIHLVGAPSHLDLWYPRPALESMHGKELPDSLFQDGKQFAFIKGRPKLMASRYTFSQFGESGHAFSNLLTHLPAVADDICFIDSMQSTEFNHGPAQMAFHTGQNREGHASMGAWVNYAIGSENRNLPPFAVFISGNIPGAGSSLWSNGYLPSVYQGIELRSEGEPVLFLQDPKGMSRQKRGKLIDHINTLNTLAYRRTNDEEIETRMAQYELAYRMQESIPDVSDLSSEPEHIKDLYGTGLFSRQCLLARRMIERNVRVVELFNDGWDHHSGLSKNLPRKAEEVDQGIAGLIGDLKQRGMLDETLVVCCAEFGRTPVAEQRDANASFASLDGRDHHKDAFSIWMAGGGVQGGMRYGETDEYGFSVIKNRVEIRDFHATVLHLMGIDHEALSFRFMGLDQRLTGVEESHVISDIFS
jgi:hypothetical protein